MQRLLLKRSLPASQPRLRAVKQPQAAALFEKLAQFASSVNRTISSTTASILDLLQYRNRLRRQNHGDTSDEQTRFQKWNPDSRSRRWQLDIGSGRRRRIGSGPPR